MHILDIKYLNNSIALKLFILPEICSTGHFPNFSQKLMRAIPSLGSHICINDENNKFAEELEETELAHAFEHILIEMIGQKDNSVKSLKAWTSWNWQKESRHTYNVEIQYGDRKIFQSALLESLEILNGLYNKPIVTQSSFGFAFGN